MDFVESQTEGTSGSLCVRRWGQGGRRVMALHGWMDHAGSFDRLAPHLGEVELAALDFPGHGRSQYRPDGAFYHFADAVPEVMAAARGLGWDKFSLLGHSMGAGVAVLFAGAMPELLESLVLVEGIGPLTDPPDQAPALMRRSLTHRLGTTAPRYATYQAAVERLEQRGLNREAAECLAARALDRDQDGFYFTQDPRLRVPSRTRLSEPQVMAFLEAIEAPTLVIWGRDGLKFKQTEARQKALREATVVELPGGHHLHLEDPESVARAIRDFWSTRLV